jgi:hypothetical protein
VNGGLGLHGDGKCAWTAPQVTWMGKNI